MNIKKVFVGNTYKLDKEFDKQYILNLKNGKKTSKEKYIQLKNILFYKTIFGNYKDCQTGTKYKVYRTSRKNKAVVFKEDLIKINDWLPVSYRGINFNKKEILNIYKSEKIKRLNNK